jgi:opine dehydrogenase
VKLAVVGAGAGGLAVAGHAGLAGHQVSVHDLRPEAVDALAARGGVEVTGAEEGLAPVAAASLDSAVVGGADLVVIVTPGPDQGSAVRGIARHVAESRLVLVMPGRTGGALEAAVVLAEAGAEVPVAETDAFPFSCSAPAPATSHIASVMSRFGVAALPPGRAREAVSIVRQLFAQAEPVESVLHTGLSNMDAILHLAPMVLNAGRIEHEGGSFDLYDDGVTPAVARVMGATDRERLAVGSALGLDLPSLLEWIRDAHGVAEQNLDAAIRRLQREASGPTPAPASLEHRYLTEAVQCGAVPVVSLGRQLRVQVDVTDHCVELACILLGRDLRASGRTVERLGLAGLDAKAIRARLLPG